MSSCVRAFGTEVDNRLTQIETNQKDDENRIAAFEELIGFHGGLGGAQGEPFVLYPASFAAPSSELVGAASIHHLFKAWLSSVADVPAPFTTIEPSGTAPDAAIDSLTQEASR